VIAGVEVKAAPAVMTLPYSDAYFVSAYPRECTEAFQAGHVAAFEFFGGVLVHTSYDNTSIAVKKVVGRERELTTEFLRLESHFLFGHHFCRVGRGNEKGHVETTRWSIDHQVVPPSWPSGSRRNRTLKSRAHWVSNRTNHPRRPRGESRRTKPARLAWTMSRTF
jgi:transposase